MCNLRSSSKMISLLSLALAATILLTGCWKSEAVQNVEELITAIDGDDKLNIASVAAAREAYDALEEKEKGKVSNIDLLYKGEFASYAAKLVVIDLLCADLACTIEEMWENAGSDYMSVALSSIKLLCKGLNFDEYVALYHEANSDFDEKAMKSMLKFAAVGLYPEGVIYIDEFPMGLEEDAIEEIIDLCEEFNEQCQQVSDMAASTFEEISAFVNEYKEDYSEETSVLNQWNVEADLYVNFITSFIESPYGSLASFAEESDEYLAKTDRYCVTVQSYGYIKETN